MLIFAHLAEHELYMTRCLQLAKLGEGRVAPNPMVGAVLVFNDVIIGEGYHEEYGCAHAEVNCINNVAASYRHLIAESTLYVSLEPCSHFGKTPPCSNLILQHQIRTVVVGCRDPFEQVNGSGINQLRAAGVTVVEGVLEQEARELNRRFFTFHQKQRPFVILKWAQTMDGFIAPIDGKPLAISNAFSNVLTHKMRANTGAIVIGTHTALNDNPKLNTRNWPGKSPLRIVVDTSLRLPPHLHLFTDKQATVVLNFEKTAQEGSVQYHQIAKDKMLPAQLLALLYNQNCQSLMVEGGSKLLQSFIEEDLWDEAVVITNTGQFLHRGIRAPQLTAGLPAEHMMLLNDLLQTYRNP